jgi:uncharacterized protein with von Willebrand factor type A (vWA) domain
MDTKQAYERYGQLILQRKLIDQQIAQIEQALLQASQQPKGEQKDEGKPTNRNSTDKK